MPIETLSRIENLRVHSVLHNIWGYPIQLGDINLGFAREEAITLYRKLDSLFDQNKDYEPTKYEKWIILKCIPIFISEVGKDIDALTGDTEQDYRDLYQKLLGMWGTELDSYRPR